ncbi:hypothetical protein [Candidatus Mycoplasma haematohominis]|uniref:Uncharacterized protein n=1 Tax=Candidatus Mycoplasma haematohominis TaxID=1494318 RepID=A0A478FV48_9MOLU|nr:hypothetical protein [Candidatus Mycoplasma haemohominis]GCE64005.1 hypothetical protein MHSWG343_10130 [Candidatus Mycoplasma haemohominis]
MAVFKVAAMTGGVILLGIAGTYAVKNWLLSLFNQKHITSPQTGTFGEDFQLHFLDTTDDENDLYWEFKLKFLEEVKAGIHDSKRDSSSLSNEFSTPNIENIEALKKICAAAYNKKTKDIHVSGGVTADDADKLNKSKYEENVWMFCSMDKIMPVTLGVSPSERDKSYEKYEINSNPSPKKENTKRSSLVSSIWVNASFWKRQTKAFFSWDISLLETNSALKELRQTNDKSKRTWKELARVCESQYKSENNEETTDEVVFKVCSLRGKTIQT